MSLFRGGIEERSAGPVPLWIMSPPFNYAQAEKNTVASVSRRSFNGSYEKFNLLYKI